MRAPRLLKLAAKLVQWSLGLLLGLVLLMAMAVAALHWWIVPRINDFRPQVESRLSQALGVPVRIDRLQADGNNSLVPAIAVQGLRIAQPDGSAGFTLDTIQVALSVPSLLRLRAEQIVINAPQLTVQRAADGSVRVAGVLVETSQNQDSGSAADWLFRQREVLVQGGSITWDDQLRGLPPVTFSDVHLLLRNPGLRHEWQLRVRPPEDWGDALELRGRMHQPIWALHDGRWKHWSGQLYLEALQLNAAAMAPYLPPAMGLQQGQGSARLWLDVTRGKLSNGTADVALRDVGVRRQAAAASDDKAAQGTVLLLRSVQGRIGGAADDSGFRVLTENLAVESANGEQWPGGSARINHVYAQGKQPSETEASAKSLDIASLAQLARLLPIPDNARQWLQSNRPAGLIRSASAHWRGDMDTLQDWQVKADVGQLAFGMPAAAPRANAARDSHGGLVLAGGQPHVGLRGLDLTIDARAGGGQAKMAFADGALYLPSVFEDPQVPITSASTQLQWTVQGEHIQMQSERLEFANAHAAGHARWSWQTADPQKTGSHSRFPGILQLKGMLERADGTQVHRYLPLHIPPDARHYVRDAVLAGQASNVQFEINGDLWEVPFPDSRHGLFRIVAPVRDVRYAYVPNSHLHPGEKPWPELNRLSGELVFEGNGMQVNKAKGILDSNQRIVVDQTSAQIPDFHATRVLVNAQANGPLADMLATVRGSAIDALTQQALAQTQADGDAQLQLKLDLPVHDMAQAKVDGKVLLPGNRIQFHDDSPVVDKVTGAVQFSEHGFALQELQGQALGGAVKFSGGMDVSGLPAGADHGPRLKVRANGVATADGLLRAKELGPVVQLAQLAQGQAAYQLDISMAQGVPLVEVRSDLAGMALALPVPLKKAADEVWPTHFASTVPEAAPSALVRQNMQLDVGGRLQLRYVRDISSDDKVPDKVVSGVLRLGAGALTLPAKGVIAEVQLPQVDVQEWQALAQRLKAMAPAQKTTVAEGAAAAGAAPPASPADGDAYAAFLPDHWDIRLDTVQVRGMDIHNLHLSGSRTGPRWRSQVSSSLLDGQLEYEQEAKGPGTIRARLSQLRVGQEGADSKAAASQDDALGQEPGQLPALDVVVEDLRWRQHSVGRLEVQAVNQRQADKSWWQLKNMVLSNDAASLHASGDWGAQRSSSGGRRTELEMRLDLKDTGALLGRLGMAGVVRQGKGSVQGRIGWTGSPVSPDYTSMDGKLHIDVGQGQFLKVEPGAAKLLGVLNLQALPRRLTLDFKDVFSAGFGFDFVRGDVLVSDGVASTTNMQMKGVTAAVLLEGSANLRDETQDLHVVVIPELNTTTMALVTTAINPVIGIGTFLAQALFKGPLTQAVTQEFEVSGSWSEPEVKRVGRRQEADSNAVGTPH
ncbi:YhdP family protein [Comamonas koreensis]|uniref:YhdP family protein n=1 Tax=Comamonas koreensis TaxID=160825 RepID=UPI0015FE5816|nr:YhdP family protein [Comamonas koreensis]